LDTGGDFIDNVSAPAGSAIGRMVMAAGEDVTRQATVRLAISGSVVLAAIALLTLLFVNFPPNLETPYGVHRHAVSFFRLLWSYPVVDFSPAVFRILTGVGILTFWGAYLFGLWMVSRLPADRDHSALLPVIFGFAIVFNVALLFYFPPILSGDVFHYAIQGRLYAVHGENPYAVTAEAVTDDPFWALSIWRGGTTQYGPVWIQLSAICASLGGGSVLLTVFLFKLLAGVSNVLGALLVVALTRRLTASDGVVPLLFYAWNPILLIESSGTAHNDAVMMTLALAGIFLLAQRRFLIGAAMLVGSALIKYVTLLLLGMALIHVLARQSSLQRLGLAIRLGLIMALMIVVFYAPFMFGVSETSQLFIGVSPALNPMPNNAGAIVRQLTAVLIQAAGFDAAAYVNLVLNGIFAVFVVLLLPGLLTAKATLADVMGRFGVATLLYSFLIYGGSFPWYLVCPLVSLAVAPVPKSWRTPH
jgi:hypothetical protein